MGRYLSIVAQKASFQLQIAQQMMIRAMRIAIESRAM
jgi:hypothetical protein